MKKRKPGKMKELSLARIMGLRIRNGSTDAPVVALGFSVLGEKSFKTNRIS